MTLLFIIIITRNQDDVKNSQTEANRIKPQDALNSIQQEQHTLRGRHVFIWSRSKISKYTVISTPSLYIMGMLNKRIDML